MIETQFYNYRNTKPSVDVPLKPMFRASLLNTCTAGVYFGCEAFSVVSIMAMLKSD